MIKAPWRFRVFLSGYKLRVIIAIAITCAVSESYSAVDAYDSMGSNTDIVLSSARLGCENTTCNAGSMRNPL